MCEGTSCLTQGCAAASASRFSRANLLWLLCRRAPPSPGFTRYSLPLSLFESFPDRQRWQTCTDLSLLLLARLLISLSQNLPELAKPHFLNSSVPPLLAYSTPSFPAETSSLNSSSYLTATNPRPIQAIFPGLPPAHDPSSRTTIGFLRSPS